MGNFIINENHYDSLNQYHQNDKDIKMYFGDNFQLNKKFLQKANVFSGNVPELKKPKENMFSSILGKSNKDDSSTEFDFDNSVKIYESMNINRVQACDHRLWAYLCHGPYYNYIKYRFTPNRDGKVFDVSKYYEYDDKDKTTVSNYINNRFFTGVDNRTLRRNGIALLWWAAELTHTPWDRWEGIEQSSTDKYYYTNHVLKDPDIYQQIFERTIGKEPKIAFALLDTIIENNLNRKQHRDLIKIVNSDVHIFHYASLPYKIIRQKMDTLLMMDT